MSFITAIIRDRATPWLTELDKNLEPSTDMLLAAAEGALPVFQRHFHELAGSNKNKFGARGGFWDRMLAGTTATTSNEAGVVRMPREVALRYFGGTVEPKAAKYLSIAARTEAYGKSPRDFDDLRFVKFASGSAALVQTDQQQIKVGRKKKDGTRTVTAGAEIGGAVFYWLVTEATIEGDEDVLPEQEDITEGAKSGVNAFVRNIAPGGSL